MLTVIFLRLLSLFGVVAGAVEEDVREEVTAPRVAQVRLAETLAEADAIQLVRAKGTTTTFVITRGGKSLDVVVKTRKQGDIVALSITPAKPRKAELAGDISWLGDELASVTAITKLTTDEDGAITLTTADGRRYIVIPGRGSGGGNEAVEARWAGEWSV